MKTKTKKRLAGAAGILIILGLLLAVDGFTGDPLSRAWAQWRALHRAGTLYPEQEFYVASSYSGQFFNYGVTVQSATILRVQIDTINILWLSFLCLQKTPQDMYFFILCRAPAWYWVSFFDLQFQTERLPSFLLEKGYRFSICYRFHFTSDLPKNPSQRKARNPTLKTWFRAYFYISVVISVPFLKVKTTLPSE